MILVDQKPFLAFGIYNKKQKNQSLDLYGYPDF